jgi:hypothetical protein
LRRKSSQKVSAYVHAQHLESAVGVDGHGDGHRHGDDAPLLAHLHVGGVDPQIRPVALDRALEEGLHPLVDVLAEPAHLALGDAGHAERLDQIVDGPGRDALDVGFLDHGGERLLRHAPGFQETGEVAPLAQLRDAQLDRAGAGFPIPLTVAVALHQPLGRTLAVAGAGQALHLQLHQPLRGKADHLAQHVGVCALLQQAAQCHHLVGHRGHPSVGLRCGDQTLPKTHDDRPAVDNRPAYASDEGRCGGPVPHSSYTTPRGTTWCVGLWILPGRAVATAP